MEWLDFSLSSTLLGHFLGTNSDLPLGVSKDRQLHGVVRCSTAKPSSSLRTSWPTFISASRLLAQIRWSSWQWLSHSLSYERPPHVGGLSWPLSCPNHLPEYPNENGPSLRGKPGSSWGRTARDAGLATFGYSRSHPSRRCSISLTLRLDGEAE